MKLPIWLQINHTRAFDEIRFNLEKRSVWSMNPNEEKTIRYRTIYVYIIYGSDLVNLIDGGQESNPRV